MAMPGTLTLARLHARAHCHTVAQAALVCLRRDRLGEHCLPGARRTEEQHTLPRLADAHKQLCTLPSPRAS